MTEVSEMSEVTEGKITSNFIFSIHNYLKHACTGLHDIWRSLCFNVQHVKTCLQLLKLGDAPRIST